MNPPAAIAHTMTVGVRTRCCGQYVRGTVAGAAAEGRCPRCGRRFLASLPALPATAKAASPRPASNR